MKMSLVDISWDEEFNRLFYCLNQNLLANFLTENVGLLVS